MAIGRRFFLSHLGWLPAVRAAEAKPARSRSLRDRISTALDNVIAVDTHEHLMSEREHVARKIDFFVLASHYALNDVISAGLPAGARKKLADTDVPAADRWRLFEPHWKNARFTGYGQALRLAVRDLYGKEEISAATLPAINDAIRSENRPGLYRKLLKERARIRIAILDDISEAAGRGEITEPDPEFFVSARKFDRFIIPNKPEDIQKLEALTNVSIPDLRGLKRAMETHFERSATAGMAAVKCVLAYQRELLFHEAPAAGAEADLQALMRNERPLPPGFRARISRPYRNLEDHMFHHLCRLAAEHEYPVQIHTGILAGNEAFLRNLSPVHLTNVFCLYPQVKFDIFHIGYPYQSELAAIAKLFPNVYIDFCWAHIISPEASRRALHEFLDTVPVNKIMGFGGDYIFPQLAYAHARMARRNIAQVLAEKAESRWCTEDEALEIGRMLLHENPAALFLDRK